MRYVAAAGSLCIYFKLCCLVVGDFFPVHPAERFALNGKVKVMLTKVCSLSSVLSRDGPRKRAYTTSGRHHQGRAELGPMPTWVVRMVAGLSWEVAGTGRGLTLFDVLADAELMLN